MTKHPGTHNERPECFCLFLQDFFCSLVNGLIRIVRCCGAFLDSS